MADTMKKTRHAGVYLLGDGRYRLRGTMKCPRSGVMLHRMRTLPQGTTEGGALRELALLKDELVREALGETVVQPPAVTLSDYAEQWLEVRAARVRASVARNYMDALGKRVLPALGDLLAENITRRHVEDWVAWAENVRKPDGEAYSQATVQGWWRVFSTMLRDAVAELGLARDPTLRVRPPRRQGGREREKRTLSLPQLRMLVATMREFFPHRYPEVLVLAYTGMRAGELYALQWSDIDHDEAVIHLRRSVWRGHEAPTKTNDPRSVPLPAVVAEELGRHRQRMLAAQHPGLQTGVVFPADNGAHRIPQSLHKALAVAAKHVGIDQRVTPQVLRRTFNTLMVLAGVDRIVLRSMMGHASEAMTSRYSGIATETKHAAVGRLLELVE